MPISSLQFEVTDKEAKKEPEPGAAKPRRGRPPGSGTKAASHAQIRDEIASGLKLAAMFWSVKDPHCAPVLSMISEDIANDLAKFAAKSPWAKKWLGKATEVGEIVPFLLHIKPLFEAIRDHHIVPAMERRNGESVTEERDSEPVHAGLGFVG